jgi:hypothetical protein
MCLQVECAYKLWCGVDRSAGRDLEFWLQAEAQVLAAGWGRSPGPGVAWPNEGHKISGAQGRPKHKAPGGDTAER